MSYLNVLIKFIILAIGFIVSPLAWSEDTGSLPEVRILIDTSGSMVENDPNNIRAPALRMLAKILPKGAEAGVWIFDTTAQSIVPVGKVDKEWVANAEIAANEIHSEGFQTNIGDALEKAMLLWSDVNHEAMRNIILLTDGLVDVSEEAWENEEAKTHIRETLIPRLQQMNVHLHTIALSDEADEKLLEQMALSTDGLYAKIFDSDQLQRVFLKLFERSFQKDSLPIEENKFIVDEMVEEITLLIFKKTNRENIKIRRPNDKVFYKFSYPKNVHWYHEGAVDMVTITKPEPGKWSIIGNVDPDNRVMIISDLGLEVTPLPANIFAGEDFMITANVTEQGKEINSKKFLNFVQLELSVEIKGEEKEVFLLNDEGTNHDALRNDGVYTTKLGPIQHLESSKDATINVTLKSNTFQRQVTQRVRLLPVPMTVETLTKVSEKGKLLMAIDVRPDFEVLKPGSVNIEAITKDDSGRITKYNVAKMKDGVWRLSLSPNSNVGQYETKFQIKATTTAGRKIDLTSDPVILAVPEITLPKPQLPEGAELERLRQEAKAQSKDNLNLWTWILIGFAIIIFNILLGSLGYVLYKRSQRQRQHQMEKLTNVFEEKSEVNPDFKAAEAEDASDAKKQNVN